MKRNELKYLRDNFYFLIRNRGEPVDIYKRTHSINIKTGIKTITRQKIKIQRALFMPIQENILTQYTMNPDNIGRKDRSVGGYVESGLRQLLIDRRDIPVTFKIDELDYLISNRERYEIQSIQRYNDYGYFLIIRTTEGVDLGEIIEIDLSNEFNFKHFESINSILNFNLTDQLNLTDELI